MKVVLLAKNSIFFTCNSFCILFTSGVDMNGCISKNRQPSGILPSEKLKQQLGLITSIYISAYLISQKYKGKKFA